MTTEQLRQKLWCDVYVELVKDVNSFEPSKGANIAVSKFDEAFQVDVKELDSYIAEKEKRTELFRYCQGLRHNQDVRTYDFLVESEQQLKILKDWFGDNYYCDVSSIADKKNGSSYYAGIADDGVDILICFK